MTRYANLQNGEKEGSAAAAADEMMMIMLMMMTTTTMIPAGRIVTSVDGSTWTTVGTFSSDVNEGWNWVDVATPTAVRYVRLSGALSGSCQVAEMEVQVR
jgi:hypothetical protein